MAETQQQDRTEEATAKRLDEARQKGQIPRSRELSMAAVLMTGAVVLYADGTQVADSMREMMTRALSFDRAAIDDPGFMTEALAQATFATLDACTPLFMALIAAAFIGTFAIGGWNFSPAPLAFKFERLNPVAGLGRMFGLNALVEVLKALGLRSVSVLATTI